MLLLVLTRRKARKKGKDARGTGSVASPSFGVSLGCVAENGAFLAMFFGCFSREGGQPVLEVSFFIIFQCFMAIFSLLFFAYFVIFIQLYLWANSL